MRGVLNKITWIQVAVIGLVVCAIIGASLHSMLIKKQQKQIAELKTQLQSVEAKAREKPQAQADLMLAQAELLAAKRRLNVYERTKMIPISLTTQVDQFNSLVRVWREHTEVLGPLMEKHIASTGMVLEGGSNDMFANLIVGQRFRATLGAPVIPIPRPPTAPSGITQGRYTINLGTITVRTTRGLPQVYSFLRSFTHAPRLVTIGAPSITGQSPNLTVTVPMQVHYLVEGAGGAMPGGAPGGAVPGGGGEPGEIIGLGESERG